MPESQSDGFAALDAQLEAALRDTAERATTIVVGRGEPVEVSPDTLKTLHKIIHGLASGNEPLLTTTEAADLLGVSRPYLTRLLKTGKIPYLKKGNRHLVPAGSLQEFKARRDQRQGTDSMDTRNAHQSHDADPDPLAEQLRRQRDEGLDELARISDEAGLYDDDVSATRLRR